MFVCHFEPRPWRGEKSYLMHRVMPERSLPEPALSAADGVEMKRTTLAAQPHPEVTNVYKHATLQPSITVIASPTLTLPPASTRAKIPSVGITQVPA